MDKNTKPKHEKKKNTETGLLMGQNTNIFSQLSATYMQNKSDVTEEEANFINSTQIIEYHDANINRLISLLRKKADVTKAKAALELREEIDKMNEENLEEFMPTFAQLFLEVVVNEQSKQVTDQFVAMLHQMLIKSKKIVIKQISTLYGPLLIINRANNISIIKTYGMLFNGTQQQLHEKGIILLLKKDVMKKFIVLSRVIVECEQTHKIGQQNYQRNCASLMKTIKDFIRSFDLIANKKEEIQFAFSTFVTEIDEIVSGKSVQEYFKFGGRAKAAILEFYQCLVGSALRHPEWKIEWEKYAKTLCQNYLDKDVVVQQTLWKHCNRQLIESCQGFEAREEQNKDKNSLFLKLLPKPDEKLLSVLKIGGPSMYKELPAYCAVFPFTKFENIESHKAIVNKIAFIRKLMATILELEDENEVRIECYYELCIYFLQSFRTMDDRIAKLEQKKQQQVKSLVGKAGKELLENLQQKYYKSPPTSRNSFSYYIPKYYCSLLEQFEPEFLFQFDEKQTFSLYCYLTKQSQFSQSIYDKIYENCKNSSKLQLAYLENFPPKSIEVDMSDKNEDIETASKIFLLSEEANFEQNWFAPHWDIRKQIIVFDPRITANDLSSADEHVSYHFHPTHKNFPSKLYDKPEHDEVRFKYFVRCLSSNEQIQIVPFLLPLVKEKLITKKTSECLNSLLEIYGSSVKQLKSKQWSVGSAQILRIRVISDIVIEFLVKENSEAKKELIDQFIENYCLFVLTIYNYRLDADSEELLKLYSQLVYVEAYQQQIFQSTLKSVNAAYDLFLKASAKSQEAEDNQRKNRMNRLLNFVDKLLWYTMNKKSKQHYYLLFQNILLNPNWKSADDKPDLWLLSYSILHSMDEGIRESTLKKTMQEHQQNKYFISLLLCCQMVLPLQRHLEEKRFFTDCQIEVLKHVNQSWDNDSKLALLSEVIDEAMKDQLYILMYGAKNLLRSVMKNYQELSPADLQQYSKLCFENILQSIDESEQQNDLHHNCLLAVNLCNELPLLDLPNITSIYSKLWEQSKKHKGLKLLVSLTIASTMWELGVGVETLNTQNLNSLVQQILKTCAEQAQADKNQQTNFIRYCALNVLNSMVSIKGIELLQPYWDSVCQDLLWRKVVQGSLFHGILQSSRYKFISRIFASSPEQLRIQIVGNIPQEMSQQLEYYKEILDQIEEGQDEEVGMGSHHENVVNMFIEFAEVLMKITSGLNQKIKPRQQTILALLQCPFPGIKRTSFLLLRQMYEFKIVEKQPPSQFLKYLSLPADLTSFELDSMIANLLLSYLYSWQILLQRRSAIQRSSSQQQYNLTLEDYLQTDQLYESFLKSIFQILETQLEFSKKQSEYAITPQQLLEMDSGSFMDDETNLEHKVFNITIRTLFVFVLNFPLFLRDFIDKNKKYRNACDRLLRNVISDAIFKEQLGKIEMREPEWKAGGNFEIYVTAKTREIYAEYTHDVIRIGLRLVMRSNYPLSPIAIEFGEGLKLDDGSRWALMLQSQLHNRNNTLINGILLWKENIDRKLAGVEECSICFDIVSNSGQLPKKACKTCKKKFHSNCIMKWFSKSNKSECPLCKSQFL